jgi:hypothetical protein
MFGDNLVECGFEAAFEVAWKRSAREDGGIDPTCEFVAKIFDDVLYGDGCGFQVRGHDAQGGAIDEQADEFCFVDADANGLRIADTREISLEEVAEGVDFEAAGDGREGAEGTAAQEGSSDHLEGGARDVLEAGGSGWVCENFSSIGCHAEAEAGGDVVGEGSAQASDHAFRDEGEGQSKRADGDGGEHHEAAGRGVCRHGDCDGALRTRGGRNGGHGFDGSQAGPREQEQHGASFRDAPISWLLRATPRWRLVGPDAG